MTKANGRILGSVIALSLVMGTAGSSLAGMSPQGMSPQGMSPQGMSPQGMSPQGMSPQSIFLDGTTLSNLTFSNGSAFSSATLSGSQLQGYVGGTFQSGAALIGTTFTATLKYINNGVATDLPVTLLITDVKQDTTKNTMVCDPMNPSATSCFRNYNSNSDVYLYKIYYWTGSLADAPVIAPICGGDQMAMLFSGSWDDENTWVQDPYQKKLTVACTQGVLTKCARNWGYKPWRTMVDKHGNVELMRSYHQACTRAATADYLSNGDSFTITGTTIDLFDNGGFNLPATSADLVAGEFQPVAQFEAIFSASKLPGSIKNDFWGKWMSHVRFTDLPQWEAMYGYAPIEWDGEAPKSDLSEQIASSWWVSDMEFRYQQYYTEMAVYSPVWSKVGAQAAHSTTVGSYNHRTSLVCNPTGKAPDRAFRWTAPTTGTYQFDTNGSSYDTVLYIWDDGIEQICDDDSGISTQSLLSYSVTAGQTITIFVDGYGTAAGDFYLNIKKIN